MRFASALVPFTVAALSACTGDGADPRSSAAATSENAPAPMAGKQSAQRSAEAGPATGPDTQEVDLMTQETAEEYIERKSREAPGETEMDPDAVAAVAACSTCHGPNGEGNPALGAPRIGGMAEWYLARQLKYFKQGIRAASDTEIYGTQMRAITLMLESNAVIEDLAAHFAALSPPPADASVSGDAQRGEELYTVCAACHGADGSGSPQFNSPSLIGQDPAYLVRQLHHYREGHRGSHRDDIFGQQMQPIVESSLQSEEDIADVVAYIATLEEAGSADESKSSASSSGPRTSGAGEASQ